MSDENFEGETADTNVAGFGGLVGISKFKGNPVISLRRTEDDAHPFSFGLSKAKLILDNIEAIEKFVNDNKK